MKNWVKENWFRVVIGLGILMISGAFVVYFIALPYQRDAYRRQQDLQAKVDEENKNKQMESGRTLCLSLASSDYQSLIELNSTPSKDGSSFTWDSSDIRNFVENKYKSQKEDCYKQYPVK